MKKKSLIRALVVGSLAVGGFAFSAAGSPASAHNCNNEGTPGDVWVQVGSTAGAGADTGTSGLVGVPVACVMAGTTVIGAGAGATVTQTPSGVTVQPYVCDAYTCNKFLIG